MFVERRAKPIDTEHDGVGRRACRKRLRHLHDGLIPERLSHALVQFTIADHGELARHRCDEDERCVRAGTRVHAAREKLFLGPLERIERRLGNDPDGNVRRRSQLGTMQRGIDTLPVAVRHSETFLCASVLDSTIDVVGDPYASNRSINVSR